MPNPARKPRSTALRVVVSKGPDLDALDRVLTETAQQLAPMVSRSGSLRARFEAELKILDADHDALRARRELVERHYQALMTGFDGEERDIEQAKTSCRNALLDGAEIQGRISQ